MKHHGELHSGNGIQISVSDLEGLQGAAIPDPATAAAPPAGDGGADVEAQIKALMTAAQAANQKREPRRAEKLLRQAIELDSGIADLHALLADSLVHQKRMKEAIVSYLNALSLDPVNDRLYCSIGTYLMLEGEDEEAVGYFDLALRFNPGNETALLRKLFLEAMGCNWCSYTERAAHLKLLKRSGQALDPFSFLPLADDAGLQKLRSEAYCAAYFRGHRPARMDRTVHDSSSKIRIGYFSNDFYSHATMQLIGRMLELHDRSRFEIHLYDFGSERQDREHERARRAADAFHQVASLSDQEIAEKARAGGIDIAIDLKGFTKGNRLGVFQCRAAPLQIAFLGYPGTCGTRAIDYMVADAVTIPQELRKHYSEKILTMPHCYQVNDDTRKAAAEVPSRASLGLPETGLVFCSFNNSYKVTPAEFDIWMQLLQDVPGSVLWFLAGKKAVEDAVLREAAARGIGADRIVFAGRIPPDQHLARLVHADLFLDTFAVNAHTTASEALWMGVPVLTKIGGQFAARVAASLLTAIGLEELVTRTPKEYAAKALDLARSPEKLAALKEVLAQNRRTAPLFDTEGYTRDFEALLDKAYRRHLDGRKPAHLKLG